MNEKKQQIQVNPIFIDDILVNFLHSICDKLLKAYGMEAMNDINLIKNIFLPLSKKPKESIEKKEVKKSVWKKDKKSVEKKENKDQ